MKQRISIILITLFVAFSLTPSSFSETQSVPSSHDVKANLAAKTPNINALDYVIKKAKVSPTIDGVLSTGEWENVSRITGFRKNTDGSPTDRPQPKVFFTFDEKNLYIGFFSPFNKSFKKNATGHDQGVWGDDSVEFMVDPLKTRSSSYQFIVNANGAYYELRNGEKDWTCDWRYKAKTSGGEWTGEISIPFAAFGLGTPYNEAIWGFNACRTYRNPTQYTSLAGVKGAYAQPEKFLRMIFKGGPEEVKITSQSFHLKCDISGIGQKFLIPTADISAIPPSQRESAQIVATVINPKSQEIYNEKMTGYKGTEVSTKIPLDNLKPGTYQIKASLFTKDGKLAGSQKDQFIKPDASKWLNNQVGIDHSVPVPWTPLNVEGGKISCWNRQYSFDDGPFPSEIKIGDDSILVGRIKLVGRVKGKDLFQEKENPVLKERHDDQVIYEITNESDSVVLNSIVTVEFDGMVRVDLKLIPPKPVNIDRLSLEIPIRAKYATLRNILKHPGGDFYDPNIMGNIPRQWTGKAAPYVWLGNEELGLAWFTETFRNWHITKEDKAIEIIKRNGRVTLIVNLIDAPYRLDKPLDYTFGLQATPVKPLPKNWLADRVSCWEELKPTILIEWAHPWTVKWFAFPEPAVSDKAVYGSYQKLISQAKAKGFKYIQYINVNYCSAGVPEYKYFLEDWTTVSGSPENDRTFLGFTLNPVCPKTSWTDFYLHAIKDFVDTYDVDGLYCDNAILWPCQNEHCGCRYEKDGKPQGSYPIFATRELQKRIYKYVKGKNPNFILVAHTTGALCIPFISFFDMYVEGERFMGGALKKVNGDYMALVPLDKFRTEFIGKNLGLTPILLAELKYYTEDPKYTETMMAISRIHGANVWGGTTTVNLPAALRLWEAEDKFGMKDAQLLPYWNNREVVSPSSENIKVSVYAKKDKMLLYISNFSKSDIAENIKINLAKLGLSQARLNVVDVYAGGEVSLTNGVLKLSVPAKRFRMIVISKI